jgi:hypothetical protein
MFQVKLKRFYVEQEQMSLLKLEFVMAATFHLNESVNYFEQRESIVHESRRKMEEVMRSQLLKFHGDAAVKSVDEEGNVSKKSGEDLLKVDLDDPNTILNKNKVFIGYKCSKLIAKFGLTPSSPQMDWFFVKVFRFHRRVAEKLIVYFRKGLTCRELEYMEAFAPNNRSKAATPEEIMFLANSFSKIVDNIRPGDGQDKLREEVQTYQLDDEISNISHSLSYDDYWGEVAKVTEGPEQWEVYEVLPRLARCLGTSFNSGSEMERGFSRQSDIHRNPKRNRMSHSRLDSHMQVRYGMESKETRQKCPTCTEKKESLMKDDAEKTDEEKKKKFICGCHCKFSEISDKMIERCGKAWRTNVSLEDTEEDEDELVVVELTSKLKEEEAKKIEVLKEALKKRTTFYKPQDMKNIYESKDDKKKIAVKNKLENLKNKTEISKTLKKKTSFVSSKSSVSRSSYVPHSSSVSHSKSASVSHSLSVSPSNSASVSHSNSASVSHSNSGSVSHSSSVSHSNSASLSHSSSVSHFSKRKVSGGEDIWRKKRQEGDREEGKRVEGKRVDEKKRGMEERGQKD